jgi:hypothetical protein
LLDAAAGAGFAVLPVPLTVTGTLLGRPYFLSMYICWGIIVTLVAIQ